MKRFPARLHVLLASDAPVGVIVRRGPTRRVATILWDRSRDTFQLGQWMKGRIYERRSDLSPDGRYFIYLALNGAQWDSEAGSSWTAISRVPYLKAVALHPNMGTWGGGGLWLSDSEYWLNVACCGVGEPLRDTGEVRETGWWSPPERLGWGCPSVYYSRLERDGWSFVERRFDDRSGSVDIFEKSLCRGWTLRKFAYSGSQPAPGRGAHWDEHELDHVARLVPIACPTWEWADLDGDRLAWASGGKLFVARVGDEEIEEPRELGDFSGMEFEAVPAPY